MEYTRRSFIKSMACNSAIAAAATLFPGISFGAWKGTASDAGGIQWQKTPCRFCGTGCGLLVGVSGERAVAVKGDPNCSVNKGLCCVKGYHSVQILYGKDRITEALVRKDGKLTPVPLKDALVQRLTTVLRTDAGGARRCSVRLCSQRFGFRSGRLGRCAIPSDQ